MVAAAALTVGGRERRRETLALYHARRRIHCIAIQTLEGWVIYMENMGLDGPSIYGLAQM
jgi:hypothetical protein